jgi:hypothetical protein
MQFSGRISSANVCDGHWTLRWANYSMMEVRAKKNGIIALIRVDILETPQFFKERIRLPDAGGNVRKIFEIVRTHPRALANGATTSVKLHFRGERKFVWNGYEIEITIPNWHHNVDLLEFNAPQLRST